MTDLTKGEREQPATEPATSNVEGYYVEGEGVTEHVSFRWWTYAFAIGGYLLLEAFFIVATLANASPDPHASPSGWFIPAAIFGFVGLVGLIVWLCAVNDVPNYQKRLSVFRWNIRLYDTNGSSYRDYGSNSKRVSTTTLFWGDKARAERKAKKVLDKAVVARRKELARAEELKARGAKFRIPPLTEAEIQAEADRKAREQARHAADLRASELYYAHNRGAHAAAPVADCRRCPDSIAVNDEGEARRVRRETDE